MHFFPVLDLKLIYSRLSSLFNLAPGTYGESANDFIKRIFCALFKQFERNNVKKLSNLRNLIGRSIPFQ